ncbi:MAG: sulfotransferase domain-containing protein [Acidimicrobiales bacterium]|jgi:hypothetical protein
MTDSWGDPDLTASLAPEPSPLPPVKRPLSSSVQLAWRFATADLRARPDFVILGTQRGGTTSLYAWLSSHPQVAPALRKEIHYFTAHYDQGPRWYRSHFPMARPGRITGEASPYMLFHPLSPSRAARDLPERTRFIVLLREPVQRTLSHYWFSRRLKRWETESLERAIELEPARLARDTPRVLRGERSFGHATYSYVARSEYATQLQAWFDAVGRDRILVVESEKMYAEADTTARILDWLGLPPHDQPFPTTNQAERLDDATPDAVAWLREHFEPHNRRLFDMLGYEMWTEPRSG